MILFMEETFMSSIENTWDGKEVVPDNTMYDRAAMRVKDTRNIVEGLQGLLCQMEPIIKMCRNQEKNSEFIQEIEQVQLIIRILNENIREKHDWDHIRETFSHKSVRYLKAGLLFKQLQLEENINKIKSEHGGIPDLALTSFEEQIQHIKKDSELGFFKNTKPADIFMSILLPKDKKTISLDQKTTTLPLSNFPFVDKELQGRCGSLLALADTNFETINQYDSVLREAATILENRVKQKTGLINEFGEILIGKAFNKDKPILRVSTNENAQNGVLLLFKGYTAFIRNEVAHNLVPLTKERTVQLLGFIDYLLSLVEESEKI